MVNGFSLILTDGLILATALWGQYWRMRAIRAIEAIEYMVAEEIIKEEDPTL